MSYIIVTTESENKKLFLKKQQLYFNKCTECCKSIEMLCSKLENTFQANLIKIDTYL